MIEVGQSYLKNRYWIIFFEENYCSWYLHRTNYWDQFTSFWYGIVQIFLTLSNIWGTSNSHCKRKTAFTQTLRLQWRKFKLNPCNTSAETRTTFLTNVREWLWQLVLLTKFKFVQSCVYFEIHVVLILAPKRCDKFMEKLKFIQF